MAELNDYIYNGTNKSPSLNITKLNNYGFFTPTDDGTGTNCKNLVLFDLTSLYLTPLPALAHDTVILKHIADEPISKIVDLYTKTEKQVFIAFDRTNSYQKITQDTINSATVLRLSPNGNELYGKSWNKKNKEV